MQSKQRENAPERIGKMERQREFEIVQHTRMNLLEIFLVEMTSRGPHGHDDLEIGLILEGSLTLFIDQERHDLRTGDLYVINRNQVHSFLNTRGRNRILAFQIHPDLYRRIDPRLAFLYLENNIIRSGALYQHLRETLLACAKVYFSPSDFRELKCFSLLFDALYQILTTAHCSFASGKASAAARNNTHRLNRITDYVAEHFSDPLSLQDIAAQEHVTPCHLSHFMKNMIGISLQEYLNQIRFEHALRLMDTTDLTLLDICLETGFSSTRYLNRVFQKNLGCSAKEYRQAKEKAAPYRHGPSYGQYTAALLL